MIPRARSCFSARSASVVPEIVLAAGLDQRHVGGHDHVSGAGEPFDHRDAGVVIPVRAADEEDLDVAELEAELLDAGANEREVVFEIAVDEDVALRGRDQVVREGFAADVVEVTGEVEWGKAVVQSGTCAQWTRRRTLPETTLPSRSWLAAVSW